MRTLQRFIFLDIDGPLNTGRNDYLDPKRYGHHFDNEAVTNLRHIIEDTGAAIVVSSSWRHLRIPRLQQLWRDWNLPGKIVGRTSGWWGDKEFFDFRDQEIEKWLAENAKFPYRYVVIGDLDQTEAIERQKKIWIQVDPICGIS